MAELHEIPDAPGLVRRRYASADPGETEQFLRDNYTDVTLRCERGPEGFGFGHDTVVTADITMSHASSALSFAAATSAMGHVLVVHPRRGGVTWTSSRHGEVQTGRGEVGLSPMTEEYDHAVEPSTVDMVALDAARVAEYAAHHCGIAADDLDFTDLRPLSDDAARLWVGAVDHVRDDVLANPWAAGAPILLGQAFHLLSAVLLSTFPNTALARATDPESPAVPDDVSPSTLREVVDYLDAHADQPIAPADITELAGRPVDQIVAGLRRRCDRHPAERLWVARLRGVRRGLLDADPGPDPDEAAVVAGLAARWGFSRVPPFRVAYLRAFDESPEQTLRR